MGRVSFSPEFRPLRFLGNPHVQTVLGSMLPAPALARRARLIPLADGDQLVLHESTPPGWREDGRIALLVHGMGGTHDSGYMRRVAWQFLGRGVRVGRLDLRGCGQGVTHARRTYNAGCSPDIRAVLADLHARYPAASLALLGFSLGGNMVLKLAGELPEHPVANLDRVVAVAPPVDLHSCSMLISLGVNRPYERFFLRALLGQVGRQLHCFPDLPRVRFPRALTLRLFDDLYTAPRGGYDGVDDYYRRASAGPLLPVVPVRTLILAARDDPFVCVKVLEKSTVPSHVQVEIVQGGGHLGFLGWDGAGGIHWAERRIVEWVCSQEV